MSDIVTDLHAVNKMVISQLPEISTKKMADLTIAIHAMVKDDIKYFMLLSNENRDYTVFALVNEEPADKFTSEVIEVLESRGKIKEFDVKSDANAIEIWVEDTFYALFPYDLGVIEI